MNEALTRWVSHLSSWFDNVTGSRRAQLVTTALISGGFTVATVLTYQAIVQDERVKYLKSGIPEASDQHIHLHPEYKSTLEGSSTYNTEHSQFLGDNDVTQRAQQGTVFEPSDEDRRSAALAERARRGDYDDDLILEQLARNRVFLKDDGLSRVRSSFVIVVGCGGVGSHASAALARSGVAKIRLIDFDQVTLSSLNRHALATLADVGTPKVQCIRRRLEQITPWVQFDCKNELFNKSVASQQLAAWNSHKPDYIIDAIDNIDSKVELLHYCKQNSLRVVSSMGAGCKSDPTRVLVGDISASIEDPLSRSTRRRLRALGVTEGIPVVFSTEKAAPGKAELQPLPEEEYAKGSVGDLGVLPDFRVRILPVLGTMPAVFGLCLANHIMLEISGYPYEYLHSKAREKLYESIFSGLQASEERLARWFGDDGRGIRIPITTDDVGYLIEEVYRARSVVSGLPTRLALVRWCLKEPVSPVENERYSGQKWSRLELGELVCMTKEEAAVHEREVLWGQKSPDTVYETAVLDRVAARMRVEAGFAKYR